MSNGFPTLRRRVAFFIPPTASTADRCAVAKPTVNLARTKQECPALALVSTLGITLKYNAVLCCANAALRCAPIWCGLVRYATLRYATTCYDTLRNDMIRRAMESYGMIRYATPRCASLSFALRGRALVFLALRCFAFADLLRFARPCFALLCFPKASLGGNAHAGELASTRLHAHAHTRVAHTH